MARESGGMQGEKGRAWGEEELRREKSRGGREGEEECSGREGERGGDGERRRWERERRMEEGREGEGEVRVLSEGGEIGMRLGKGRGTFEQ